MKHRNLLASLRHRRRGETGFTLIELIIVIAIIGILVAIAVPVYGAIQDNARDKQLKAVAVKALNSATAAIGDDDPSTDTATAFEALTNNDVRVYFYNFSLDNEMNGVPYSEELFCVRADTADSLTHGIHTGPGCSRPGIDIPASERF